MRWVAGYFDAAVDGNTDVKDIVEFWRVVGYVHVVGSCPKRDREPANALRRRTFGSSRDGIGGVKAGAKVHSARVRHK
jgi:hypothetical protein